MADLDLNVEDLPKHEHAAHLKAVAANVESMGDDELWEWLDTLPAQEAIALLIGCKEIQECDKKERD